MRGQGPTEVRWRPGQENNSVPPGNKCTVLKQVLSTLIGLYFSAAPLVIRCPGYWLLLPPQYAPVRGINLEVKDCITSDMLTCSTTTRLSSRSRGVEEILGQWSRVSVKLSWILIILNWFPSLQCTRNRVIAYRICQTIHAIICA